MSSTLVPSPSSLPCYLGDKGTNNTLVTRFINKSLDQSYDYLINANGGEKGGGTHSESKG